MARPLALVFGLLMISPVEAMPRGAIDWDPGNGLTLPGDLWLAGDVTIEGEALEHVPASIELDDFSLLARWEATPRLALFGEMRVEDLVAVVKGEEGIETGAGDVAIERLYAEILLTPALTLRVGKVFTPFGLWNVVHRAPLTWTVDRPSATENLFPQRATGLSLLYQTTWQGWSFDATTYGPAQDELVFRRTDDDELDDDGLLFGGRVAAGHALGAAFAAVGVNAASFRAHADRDWTTVTGLDVEVTVAGHQLTGELTFQTPPHGHRTVQGLYVQDVVPLSPIVPALPELYGVLRFEQFQPRHGGSALGGVVGLFWRPVPPVVLRANYFFASEALDDFEPGFRAGLSLLF